MPEIDIRGDREGKPRSDGRVHGGGAVEGRREGSDSFATTRVSHIYLAVKKISSQAHLKCALPSLSLQLRGGGSNLSTGQKQLLCLARALLRFLNMLHLWNSLNILAGKNQIKQEDENIGDGRGHCKHRP